MPLQKDFLSAFKTGVMESFFKKIRHDLINNEKTRRYLKYAIGEILLIVIGIFIALQLQNWNENRKQRSYYRGALDQIYSSIHYDLENFEKQTGRMENQIILLDYLLDSLDQIPTYQLPYLLCYSSFEYSNEYQSQTPYHISNLKYNPSNNSENGLTRHIVSYVSHLQPISVTNLESEGDILLQYLLQQHIAFPRMQMQDLNRIFEMDSTYYSPAEVDRVHLLLLSPELRSVLKTYRSDKILQFTAAKNRLYDARSILNLIKNYYPEVQIIYQDVGIIGTSLQGYDDVGAKSTPMVQTDVEENVWEITIFLKEGSVKFRCRDSWTHNWGGGTFPKGQTRMDGPNIPVSQDGRYKVVLDLNNGTYNFLKLENENLID